ncbi:uncharacterized protein H6S33_006335 [Morchella sextelata]|uniref:uncharacterized protein n=1 Tax=Morchella sextelata TaxID=1174677 RepID=UPI001D03A3A4|nr:uncharacterized protein H6S33_006335 [Morchella sextelata]KAH0604667.1 hypothetical protein H6S33_006335 [Morchella sextelata]
MGTADHPESRDKVICGHFIFRGIDPIRQSLTKSDGNGRIREASRMHMHQARGSGSNERLLYHEAYHKPVRCGLRECGGGQAPDGMRVHCNKRRTVCSGLRFERLAYIPFTYVYTWWTRREMRTYILVGGWKRWIYNLSE